MDSGRDSLTLVLSVALWDPFQGSWGTPSAPSLRVIRVTEPAGHPFPHAGKTFSALNPATNDLLHATPTLTLSLAGKGRPDEVRRDFLSLAQPKPRVTRASSTLSPPNSPSVSNPRHAEYDLHPGLSTWSAPTPFSGILDTSVYQLGLTFSTLADGLVFDRWITARLESLPQTPAIPNPTDSGAGLLTAPRTRSASPVHTFHGPVTFEPVSFEPAPSGATLAAQELARYTRRGWDLAALAGVSRIVLCARLAFRGAPWAGVPVFGAGLLFLDAAAGSPEYRRRVFHHEALHLILYAQAAAAAPARARLAAAWAALAPAPCITAYAASDPEEDMCEVYGAAMVYGEAALADIFRLDPVVLAKAALVLAFVQDCMTRIKLTKVSHHETPTQVSLHEPLQDSLPFCEELSR